MRFSRALIPTVKEAPADATNVSHVLLTRAGFIRRVGAGMYDFLPLGLRVLKKVEAVVRQEMDRAGALEILMPALLPAEYFQETARWDGFGDALFRLKDRKGADYHLGPTHEEIVTDIARREIHSWRDMPKNLYQIQTKFRDEPRPVAADSGSMGGSTSAEFQVLVESGEDDIVSCDACSYAANVDVATVRAVPSKDEENEDTVLADPRRVHTPGHGTIDDVARFLGAPKERFMKSLLYVAGGETVMVVVRGDHDVNETRLARALGVDEVSLASEADVVRATGAAVGFAGPVGFVGKVLVDRAASLVRRAITGANETDYHLVGVYPGQHYRGRVVDVRLAATGDACPSCAEGKLVAYKGIEGGHIFILGTHYSEKMGATFSDEQQQKRPIVMGCYGIGVSRLVATTIEQHHDADGMKWPMRIAPYQVHLVTIGKDAEVVAAGQTLYDALERRGVEVLWDDRDERPGVKFKDADLLGVPIRVTVGGKTLAAGHVEVKARSESDPKKSDAVPVAEAAERIASKVKEALAS